MLLYRHMSPRAHPSAPQDPLEPVWRALGDATRRALLDRLRERPHTTGELAAAFPQTRFAVMKHLDILVGAGLVLVRREGRERWNHLNPVPLQHLYERWVRPYEGLWAASMVRFRERIEASPHSPLTPDTTQMQQDATPPAAGLLTITLEIPISAGRQRVWEALTREVAQWWPRDFLVAADRMQFQATLGGRLYEEGEAGDGVTWYTVYAIVPNVSLDLVGHLSPAFGGPAQSLLRLVLRDEGDRTVLELTDGVVGKVGSQSSDTIADGWRAIFDAGLRAFVEANLRN